MICFQQDNEIDGTKKLTVNIMYNPINILHCIVDVDIYY